MEVEFKLKKRTTAEEAEGAKTKVLYVPTDEDLKNEMKLEVTLDSIAKKVGLPTGFINDTVMIDIGRITTQQSLMPDKKKKNEKKNDGE